MLNAHAKQTYTCFLLLTVSLHVTSFKWMIEVMSTGSEVTFSPTASSTDGVSEGEMSGVIQVASATRTPTPGGEENIGVPQRRLFQTGARGGKHPHTHTESETGNSRRNNLLISSIDIQRGQ